jgi:micrococcal nuclease
MILVMQRFLFIVSLLIVLFNTSPGIDTSNPNLDSSEPVTSTAPTSATGEHHIDSASPSAQLLVAMTPAQVISVVDGDTIKVSIDGKTESIRLIGIDTPETVKPRSPVQCYGREASSKMKELVSGMTVYLEADPSQDDRDRYKRLLRFVFLSDGTDAGLTMINDGFAHEYTYNKPYKYQTAYLAAQSEARSIERGLWSDLCQITASPALKPTIE